MVNRVLENVIRIRNVLQKYDILTLNQIKKIIMKCADVYTEGTINNYLRILLSYNVVKVHNLGFKVVKGEEDDKRS